MEYSLTYLPSNGSQLEYNGLNPYSNGILPDIYPPGRGSFSHRVLILILMEYSLTNTYSDTIVVNECLNPYSNGILPDRRWLVPTKFGPGLNPYSNGILPDRCAGREQQSALVLILILMEYSLT